MDRLRVAALQAAACLVVLGQQGVRVGSVELPEISVRWLLLAAAVSFFLAPRDGERSRAPRYLAGLAIVAAILAAASVSRSSRLAAPLDLEVTAGDRPVQARSLQLERRRDLNRLAGRRRNVVIRASGVIDVGVSGRHHIDLDCDDACTLRLGDRELTETGELTLDSGAAPFELSYRQGTGPAHLRWGWNTPRLVELLPLEHYVGADAEGASRRRSRRLALHGLLVLCLAGWLTLLGLLERLARSRDALLAGRRYRLLPAAAAVLFVFYGGALRLAAFRVHSGEGPSSVSTWLPPYGSFDPANAPADPYRADVRSYLDRAEEFTWLGFYAPSFREPFYIALNMPFLAAAGGEVGVLVQSLFFSCATLLLFYAVCRRLHGVWWASALLVPVALHEWLVLEAPTGYRMSAYAFFLLATVAWMFVARERRVSAALGGLLAGLLCLIRLSALSAVVPLALLKLWSLPAESRRRYALELGLVATLVVAPFLLSNLVAHGDPFYSISFHTEFWLRAEGLDTSQGSVPWHDYLVGSGRLVELARGTGLGMTWLPVERFWLGLRLFPFLDAFVLAAGIVGLAAAAFAPRRYGFLVVAYVGHLIPFAYIQNFPSGQMPRFVMPAYFFLVLAIPLAREAVLTPLRRVANVNER